jgi:hypothetical protein
MGVSLMHKHRKVVLLGLKERRHRQAVRIRLGGLATIALGAALVAWGFSAPGAFGAWTALRLGFVLGLGGVVMLLFGALPPPGESVLDAPAPRLRYPRASAVLSIEEGDCTEIAPGDELFARLTVHEGDVVGVSRMSSGPVKLTVVDPDANPEYGRLYRVLPARAVGRFRLTLERVVQTGRPDAPEANPFADLFS